MSALSSPTPRRPIVDAHLHFYDADVNTHAFLDQKDATYETLVPGYLALPRRYLPEDYLADTKSREVAGVIWHEYLSGDAVAEARWAARMADQSPVPIRMVGLVDFLDPRLPERLEAYRALPRVTAVREHLGWDASNPLRRFALRPDLLTDPAWLRGLESLRTHHFKCGLEVFAPQLPELLDVVRKYPEISFTIAVMGWPLDLSPDGFKAWRRDLQNLGPCENVCADISAIECIFGMNWTTEQITPWVLSLIETFGPSRCMFGSHLPISKLAASYDRIYDAYEEIVAGFTPVEQDLMFSQVAREWFGVR